MKVNWVERIRPPYLTLSGKIGYFAGLIAVVLSVKLEQRSLLLFGALLLFGVGASLYLTWSRVRGLSVSIERPRVARAFVPSPVHVQVESPRGLSGLLVLDQRRPALGPMLHIARVPPTELIRRRAHETYTRRGVARAGPLAFSSSRPFGLATSARRHGEPTEVLVLPPIGTLSGPLQQMGWQGRRHRHRPAPVLGAGADTLYLRAWRPGDSMRRIHWRASARRGELMAREFDEERGGLLVLGFGSAQAGHGTRRRVFETAIALAATLMHETTRRHRDVLLLLPNHPEPFVVPVGRRDAIRVAEEALARLGPEPGWPDWNTLPDRAQGCATVLIHPGGGVLPVKPVGAHAIDADEAVRRGWFRARGGFAP